MSEFRDKIDELWRVRNIDFYGNVRFGANEEEIESSEVKKGLKLVEQMIVRIEKFLKE